MKIRFIGNVTVKGVSYKDGDEDDISDANAAQVVLRGGGVRVETPPVQAEEPVVEEPKPPASFFKRNAKR